MTLDELDEAWQVLTDKQKTVLTRRFGLNGGKPETFEAIAKSLGVAKQAIKYHEAVAIRKLRRAGRELQLTDKIPSFMFPAKKPASTKPRVKRKKKFVLPKLKKPPRAPYKTDKERLDWLESEIRVRSLYIDWSDIRGWSLRKNNHTVSADDLRELIDEAIATLLAK